MKNTRMTLGAVLRLWMACLCFLAATLTGQTQTLKEWNGSVSSDWATPANWTPAAVPVAGDSVRIPGAPTNQPVIVSGTLAKAKNTTVASGASLTINVGGELELVSSFNVPGLILNDGTVVNSGLIKVKSGFQGIINSGNFTNNGTIRLGEATSSPYAFKEDGIQVSGAGDNFTNSSTGNIIILRAGNNGILLFLDGGNFTNYGKITVRDVGLNPAVAATADGIDAREGDFVNETTGDIVVSKITANGLNCRSTGSFTNKGNIKIGNVGLSGDLALREGINNSATFTNTSTGQITIDTCSNNGILNTNTFTNSGAIAIGVSFPASIGHMGLANFAESVTVEANFVNEPGASLTIRNVAKTGIITAGAFQPGEVSNKAGATISIDQTELYGIEVVGLAGFDNYGLLQIGLNGSIREYGIRNGYEFANQQTGEIVIQNTGEAAIYNAVSSTANGFLSRFRSAGRISIGQAGQAGDVAVYNDNQCTFELLGCKSLLHLLDNNTIGNDGTFSNQGNIIENANNESRISTNSGMIQNLNGGDFLVTGSNTGAVVTASGLLWTGCFDTNWNADYNWNTVTVPTATDVVVIPNVNNDPVIKAGVNAFAKSVQVLPDAALTIQEKLTLDGAEHYSLYNQGSVTNNGTVLIGQATGGGAHGIRNAATFLNNTGAEIHIDRTASNANGIGIGLWNESGTFTNKAKIVLGNDAEIGVHGLYNNATFQNAADGEIQIDRASENALMNNSGAFHNAAKITIGANAGSGNSGLRNNAEFNNNTGGNIRIDATYNSGLRNDAGTFNNAAQLTIGAVYGVGQHGIWNIANFNHTAGEIHIDRSTIAGIRTSGGTFANAAKIVIGATASTGKSGILIGSPFNNNVGGDIRIDRATQSGIAVNITTFTNAAKITIGAGAGITGNGIHNQDNFYNNVGGEIKIDQTTNTGIFNEKYYPADPGYFGNSGKITIGATAGTGLHGIYNSGWFQNNSGGEMAMDRSSLQGIKNIIGTFENTGHITIGELFSTGDYGVYNDAVFQNNTNAQLRVARSIKEALHNHEGATFHNRAEIIIGAEHPAGDYGIFNFGIFNNHLGGDISIDRCVKSGLHNRQGDAVEFHNYANLVIGGNASAGEHGIFNFETFENHEGGSIYIDSCTMSGLENVYGTFTNSALLRVGASASTGPIGISNVGTLENESGGSIYINRSTQTGLNTISLFRNRGQVHIGDQASIGQIGMWCVNTVENLGGAIHLDRSSERALSSSGTFTNEAALYVGALGPIGNAGIQTNQPFYNNAAGTIRIEGYAQEGFNSTSQCVNQGQLTILGSNMPDSYGMQNSGQFTNAACGILRMANRLRNFSNFENLGLFSCAAGTLHANSGSFTNNGILEYPLGNPIPNVTNNSLVAQAINDDCQVTPALSIGNSNNFTVGTTWYTDAGLSNVGGTFNQTTNTFTVTNLPEGNTHTLFFNVHDDQNDCDRTLSVQFDYDDVTPPVLQCPTHQTIEADAACSGAVGTWALLSKSDLCASTITEYQSPSATTVLSGHNDFETVTITANDGHGNVESCSFTVTLKDNTAPTITCPANIATTTDAGQCGAVTTYTVTASDNCSYTLTQTGGWASGTSFPLGMTTVAWKVTDTGGNSTVCSFTVTVTDAQAPTITCPANIVQTADAGQCSAVTNYTVTASDNCSYTLTRTNGFASGTSFPTGTNLVNWQVTDVGGNSTICSFTVTVTDGQNPSIVCPANLVKTTDAGQCSTIVTYTAPTFSDNCSSANIQRTSGPASGSAFPKGTTMVNWVATDASGNSSLCGFTVTVNDAQAPSITCPVNLVKSTDAGQCTAVVTYTTPVFTDNCTGATGALFSGGASGSAFPKGANSVVWQATDGTGLTARCTFTITVNDNQTPVISCPGNQTKNTDAGLCTAVATYPAPTFTDNCTGGNVTLQSGLASGSAFPKGLNTVVWRATDAAGLTKTCTFRVTVNDTQAPTITCPANQSKTTDVNVCTAVATYNLATFTDNCPGGSVVKLSGLNSGAAFPKGTSQVMFKATDAAGNQSLCTMTITVTDAQLPTVACPANMVVTGTTANGVCSAVVSYTTPAATDNCGLQSNFLWSGLASGSVFPQGVTTNVWKATDGGGLTATCAFTVTVGCGTNSSLKFEVRSSKLEVPAIEHEYSVNMRLAPNPATTEVQITIEGLTERGGQLTVFDAQGRVVGQQFNVGSPTASIQVSDLPSGLYQVRLQTENGVVTKGLMVARN